MNKATVVLKRWQSFLARANSYVHGQVTSAPIDDPLLMQWYVSVMHLHDIFPLKFVHVEKSEGEIKIIIRKIW